MARIPKVDARTVALAVLVSVIVLGCSPAESPTAKGPAGQGGTEQTAEQPKRGGTLIRSAGNSSYAGTDPAMGQMSYNVWPQIGLMMLKYEPATWKIVGDGIESWDFSKDGKELTLRVRKGVKFFNYPPINGREVEAKDVVYTLKTISGKLYPQLPAVRFPRKGNYEEMVDAVAADKYTVKITLSDPSSTFLSGLAEYRSGHILPDGLREGFGDIQSLAEPDPARYFSAGPFRLTEFTQLTQAVYERNPDYWQAGKPYLDGIKEIFIADKSTENAAFIAGQLDYVAPQGNEDRDFILGGKKEAVVVNYTPSSCWYRIAFNTRVKPFDDVRVRKAIAMVLDPAEAGQQARGDWQGKPLWKYPGPLPWVFPEAIPQEELAKLPFYEHPKSEKTLAEARRLMAEAGYTNGFEFELFGSKLSVTTYAPVAKAQIERGLPGMKIRLDPVDNAINHQRSAEGKYQAQYYCYIHEASSVAQMRTPYDSKGGRNFTGYSSAKMDQLLDQAGREIDDGKRAGLLREAQLLALEDMPYVPTFHNEAQVVLQPWVKGLRFGAATIERVWLEDAWFTSAPKR